MPLKPLPALSFFIRSPHLAQSSDVPDAGVRNILVVEYWHLGDLVMQMPFLQNLRLQYPAAHIVLLASPKAAPLLANQKVVDEIILVSVPWAQPTSA